MRLQRLRRWLIRVLAGRDVVAVNLNLSGPGVVVELLPWQRLLEYRSSLNGALMERSVAYIARQRLNRPREPFDWWTSRSGGETAAYLRGRRDVLMEGMGKDCRP